MREARPVAPRRGSRPPVRLAVLCAALALHGGPVVAQTVEEAVTGGRLLADLRLRYEHVDQQGFARDAHAVTARARLGWETLSWNGLHVLLEGEALTALGARRFDDTVAGRTDFPAVPDPDALELNQGYLGYQGIPGATFRLGRQRITLDNHRFIGNVGFRQNEQTFDAVTLLDTGLIPDTEIAWGFIGNVNRILGDDAEAGDFRTRTHYLNLGYTGFTGARLSGYAYLVDLDPRPELSSATVGMRVAGTHRFRFNRDLALLYAAEFAWQRDHGGNPGDYGLPYLLVEPGVALGGLSARVGFEMLAGDGRNAVQAPLGTLHGFQGATDKFVVTPPEGIRDLYLDLVYDGPGTGLTLQATFHDFRTEEGGRALGREWYARVTKNMPGAPLDGTVTLSAEYAFYQARGFSTDTHHLWLTVGFTP